MTSQRRDIDPEHVHVWQSSDRRSVLAPYLGVQPEEIEFGADERGKPTIGWPSSDIKFNVSHSGEVELVAVAFNREVGIDVEQINPERAIDSIARRFFSPNELVELGRAGSEQRVQRFFELWTVKEARLKVTGRGLAGIEEHVAVEFPFKALELPPGYVGCVAVAAGSIELLQF